MKPDEAELIGVRARFCGVVARWCLTQRELGALLGVDPAASIARGRVLPDVLDVRGETALRLLVRADHGLGAIMPEDGRVARWIREPAPVYDGATPLEAMGDLATLRAIVQALESRTKDCV